MKDMNKLYKKLSAGAVVAVALSQAFPAVAAAPSLDELIGNKQFYGTYQYAYGRGFAVHSVNTDIKIEKVGDNKVVFRKFSNATDRVFDLYADYNPQTGEFTFNHAEPFYKAGTTNKSDFSFYGFDNTTWAWRKPTGTYPDNYKLKWHADRTDTSVIGKVSAFPGIPGAYSIQLNDWVIADNHVDTGQHQTHEFEYLNNLDIIAYTVNAHVTEEHRTISLWGHDSHVANSNYNVNVVFDDDSKFRIVNFNNIGAGYDNFNWAKTGASTYKNVFIDGVLNSDGTVVLGNFTGEADSRSIGTADQTSVFRNQNADLYMSNGWYTYKNEELNNHVSHRYFKGIPNGYKGSVEETITGTWQGTDLAHFNYHNGWSKKVNGGTCETRTGVFVISLNPYVGVTGTDASTTNKESDYYKDTRIALSEGHDETFDAAIRGISIKHDPNTDFITGDDGEKKGYFYVSMNVSNWTNEHNVESVDLYYIEGLHTGCATVDLSKAKKLGTLTDFSGDWITEQFVVFPTSYKTEQGNVVVNKDFSFFLKANYKPVSSVSGTKEAVVLEPTYLALTSGSANNITTAVDLTEATGVNVENVQGGIVVRAEGNAAVEVYNMSGVLVAAGNTNETIAINATGVLMVRVNGNVFKIMK